MASGVFGLRKVYKKQVENVTNNNFASWPEGATYGYIAGGQLPPPWSRISTIHRIDFATDNIQALNYGNGLNSNLTDGATVKTSSYGYIGGGFTPPVTDVVRRYDFSTLTASNPGNNLPTTVFTNMGLQTRSYGYFCGGESPAVISSIFKLDFSNETISDPGNYLPGGAGRSGGSGLQSSEDASDGYLAGGYAPLNAPNFDEVFRLNFPTETVSDTGSDLVLDRSRSASFSSLSTGYQAGSTQPTFSPAILKWSFETETSSSLPGIMPASIGYATGVASNENGYVVGGINPTPARVSSVHKLNFSTDTLTSSLTMPPGTLISQSSSFSGGASVARGNGYGTYGYHIGGFGPPSVCNITRQDFSSNTFSDVGTIPSSLYGNDRSAYNNEYGYFGGGYSSTPPPSGKRSSIYRFDFSSELVNTLTNTLPQIADKIAHTSTREVGYFGGGYSYRFSPPVPATWHSKICKLDFSSESVSTLPASGRLSAQKGGASAVRTPQYAFFGGGYNQVGPASYSKIDRLDFSTEVASAYTNMTRANVFHTSIENNTHGYYWGGGNGYNDADKLQFSNGTVTNLPGIVGSNPYYYYQNSQTDSYYGYFLGGGFQPYPFAGSFGETLVRRLDFSSDTVAILSPKIPRKAGTSASMSNKY